MDDTKIKWTMIMIDVMKAKESSTTRHTLLVQGVCRKNTIPSVDTVGMIITTSYGQDVKGNRYLSMVVERAQQLSCWLNMVRSSLVLTFPKWPYGLRRILRMSCS